MQKIICPRWEANLNIQRALTTTTVWNKLIKLMNLMIWQMAVP